MICDITETALYIEYKNSSLLQCTLDYVLGGGGGKGGCRALHWGAKPVYCG